MSMSDNVALQIEVAPSGLPNLVQNPDGDLGTWGYVTPVGSTTLTREPDGSGAWWLKFGTSATQNAFMQTEHMPVAAGQWLSVRINVVNFSTANESYRLSFAWYNASKVQIGTSSATSYITATNTTYWYDTQAPANTAYARLNIQVHTSSGNLQVGRWMRFNSLMVTKTASSGMTGSGFAFTEPIEWLDILGPATSLSINRSALDTGTLAAEILDADLDPAIASTIRQGKRIRVLADHSDDGWKPLFTGRVATAKTSYAKAKGGSLSDKGAVRISLTATDNISHLASQGESRGVAAVYDLAYLLEGKGVPWSLDGDVNQYAGFPTVVSSNAEASVLDQIAITRDTLLGYAWVGANNVLNVYNPLYMPTSVVASFSDAPGSPLSYTDISTDFDLSDITNVVTVNWLRYVGGETQSITYGPYTDGPSVAEYGAYGRTFTIHGYSESSATIAAYAADILAANANPEVTCRSLTMFADDDTSRDAAIDIDLYSPIEVEYADRVDATIRVTSIQHTITPNAWHVTYSLNPTDTVASPQVTPSPSATSNTDTGWIALPFASNWANAGFGWQNCQYRRVGDNLYLRGLAVRNTSASGTSATIATLPAGFRPAAFNPIGSAYWTASTAASQISILNTGAIVTSASVPSGNYVPLTAGPISLA